MQRVSSPPEAASLSRKVRAVLHLKVGSPGTQPLSNPGCFEKQGGMFQSSPPARSRAEELG
eukprot:12897587-Heterocapsa_arctica.AAC.1